MHELVGRALAEGEKFWHEIGVDYDSEEDDDYIESPVEEDEVDSDFDVSDDEGEGVPKRRGRKTKVTAKKKGSASRKAQTKAKGKSGEKCVAESELKEPTKEPEKSEEQKETPRDGKMKPVFVITRVEVEAVLSPDNGFSRRESAVEDVEKTCQADGAKN